MAAAATPLEVSVKVCLADFVGSGNRAFGDGVFAGSAVIDDTDGVALHPVDTLVGIGRTEQFAAVLGTGLDAVVIADRGKDGDRSAGGAILLIVGDDFLHAGGCEKRKASHQSKGDNDILFHGDSLVLRLHFLPIRTRGKLLDLMTRVLDIHFKKP